MRIPVHRLNKIRDVVFLVVCWYSVIMSVSLLYLLNKQSKRWAEPLTDEARLAPMPPRYDRYPVAITSTKDISNDDDDDDDGGGGDGMSDRNGEDEDYLKKEQVPSTSSSLVTASYDNFGIPGYVLLDSNEAYSLKCHRCSLVSSSGQLYESGAGADIDRADCVLRMNTAPVRGWEEDVGSRTDIRIIGHVNLPRGLVKYKKLREEILASEKTRTKYVVVPWLYKEEINPKTNRIYNIARNFSNDYPKVKFVFLTDQKYNETEVKFKLETGMSRSAMKTWFSTGFVSMMFALDVCDEVNVYGLANGDFCRLHPKSRAPYHYYEPSRSKECTYQKKNEEKMKGGHKFITERAVFSRWSLFYNIRFHYPSWKSTIDNVTADIDTPFLQKYKEALKNGTLKELQKGTRRVRVVRRRVRKHVEKESKSDQNYNITKPKNADDNQGPGEASFEKGVRNVNQTRERQQQVNNVNSKGKTDKTPQNHTKTGNGDNDREIEPKKRKIIRRIVKRRPKL